MVATATAQDRAALASARTGIDRVDRISIDLSQIDENGIFVDLDGVGFRRLDTKLSWRALGVDLPPSLIVRVRQGSVDLLPEEHCKALKRPLSHSSDLLRRYGMTLTATEALFGGSGYRWIPWSAFETWDTQFAAEVARLEEVKAAILEDYDSIYNETVQSFIVLAQQAAQQFNKMGTNLDSEFVATVVSELERQIPGREFIKTGLQLRRRIGVVMLGSELAAEQTKIAREHAAQQQAMVERSAQVQVTYERAQAEIVRIRKEEEIKAKMANLKFEAARSLMERQLSPVQEGINMVLATMHEVAKDMKASLTQVGQMRGASHKKARKFVQFMVDMNWTNDAQVAELAERLAASVEGPVAEIKVEEVLESFQEIMNATWEAAREMTKADRVSVLEF